MHTYRVTMSDSLKIFSKTVDVTGCSRIDAGDEARKILGPQGYRCITNCICLK